MAGKDFAQVEASKKSGSVGGFGSLLTVLGIAFIAVVCFTAGFWLGADRGAQYEDAHPELDAAQAQMKVMTARTELQQARIEVLEKLVEAWEKKAEQGATAQVGELKFYHDLPMQSVTPSPLSDLPASSAPVRPALPSHPAKPTLEKSGSIKTADMRPAGKPVKVVATDTSAGKGASNATAAYRIQVASFRSETEAARFQKKLFNAGFSAFIRSVNLAKKGKWHRVYAGPYSSKDAAKKALAGIHKLTKIKGILVRGR